MIGVPALALIGVLLMLESLFAPLMEGFEPRARGRGHLMHD